MMTLWWTGVALALLGLGAAIWDVRRVWRTQSPTTQPIAGW